MLDLKTVPKSDMDQQYCPKCRKTMKQSVNFYLHRNGEYDEICRKCLTMHIDPWDTETFMWLLERFDVPWIEPEWTQLRDRAFAKDPIKFNPQPVFGKYIGKMRLKQFKGATFADTERLAQERKELREAAGQADPDIDPERIEKIKEAYEKGEISEAQYQTYAETAPPSKKGAYEGSSSREELAAQLGLDLNKLYSQPEEKDPKDPRNAYPANSDFEAVDLKDIGAELTEEDKVAMALKWGRFYRADEWVSLEKLYREFMQSFDIQGAARIDTLKMICKTSLKANQALDAGDVDSFQKLSRVYDALMKSAKFTEAQNKAETGEFIDSVGAMVAYCEQAGGKIPRFQITAPLDIVDKTIADMKAYNKSLIYEDKALSQEIEMYLRNKAVSERMRIEQTQDKPLTDQDYLDFTEAEFKLQDKDAELMRQFLEEGL